MAFVHLHTHSEYSLLDGAASIKNMVNKAARLGMPAVALTDHGSMYGVFQLFNACKNAGVKPIVGCEVYVAPRSRQQKEGKQDAANYHLILLAKNELGYKNLIKIVSLASMEGFYYRPRIDWDLLQKYHEGLICTSACTSGELAVLLIAGRYNEAKEKALKYRELFGEDYYFEVQNHGLPEQKKMVTELKKLSAELNIPIIATNDSHYVEDGEAALQDTLMCIQQGKILSDADRLKFTSDQLYFKSAEEMLRLFPENPEFLEKTLEIADKINFQFDTDARYLPKFDVPAGHSEESWLEELTWRGIKKRYGDNFSPEVKARVEMELAVIKPMGFSAYFLIVQDFINWAKNNGIPVGPGRGSAAGSIVAYSLNITTLDPLRYNLLFERFLNKERVSMPDIDVDFCIRRRGEVIDYVRNKYGDENVAQIITFGTMAARGVVRDVGRVMDIPLVEVDKIAKMIPATPGITLEQTFAENPEFKALYENNREIKELLDRALKLEGFARNTGTHAAGIVISGVPLMEIVPLSLNNKDNSIVTQYTMTEIERLGLLKMDFLGLRNLTMIDDCLKLIKKNIGITINIEEIDLHDVKTFNVFRQAETMGIFQCESAGMRAMIKKIQPSCFEDIIAILALYRPGPLNSGMVDQFIERKHGRVAITYDFADLEPYLKDTYGIILYQEQVMQIASVIGGFTMSQADELRRAMGKKQIDVMNAMRLDFVEGAVAKGHAKKASENIYDLCAKFAEYGFNKSHSAAYAVITYQTAWLKANYPLEFFAALLSSVAGNETKVMEYINECSRLGIEVLPPSVNESDNEFSAVNGAIRFGLSAVKNVGANAIEAIVTEREKSGLFRSFTDLCLRVDTSTINKKTVESLARSGALDFFGKRRAIIEGFANILDNVTRTKKEMANGQESLFGTDFVGGLTVSGEDNWPDVLEYSSEEKLKMEKELLGLYISDHPLKHIELDLSKVKHHRSVDLLETPEDTEVKLIGLLTQVNQIFTRSEKYMAVAKLEDLYGSIPVVCFPRSYNDLLDQQGKTIYKGNKEFMVNDLIVILEGKVNSNKRDERQVVISKITPVSRAIENQSLYIDVEAVEDDLTLNKLKDTLQMFRGSTPVILHTAAADIGIDSMYWVNPEVRLRKEIDTLIGSGRHWLG